MVSDKARSNTCGDMALATAERARNAFNAPFAETHPRIEGVLGQPMPPEHAVHGLDQLPAAIEQDAETLYERCGSLLTFAYLFHVTDATFGDVKAHLGARGWTSGVED